MNLDNTYSISEAVLALEKRQRHHGRDQSSPARTKSNDGPVDVVAIVSGVATLNSALASSSLVNATPRVDLRIIDPSIRTNHVVAKVSLYGSMEVARVAQEQISSGDIIRFNRLGLGRHHHPQDSNQDDDHNILSTEGGGGRTGGSTTALLHFEISLADPEPGFRWFKLGRIRIITTTPGEDERYDYLPHHHHDHNVSHLVSPGSADNNRDRRAILSDDRRGARDFPHEMITSDRRIRELLEWYARRGPTGHGASTTCISGSSVVVASLDQERIQPSSLTTISFAGDNDVRSLSPLPCKRRSLSEIQASSGLLSNVIVRITHYDSQVIPLQSTATKGLSGTSPRHVRHRQLIGFGSVTDSSGVIMSFVDPGDRFGSSLQAGAEDPNKVIMMTNVMSKKQSEIFGRPLVAEEVVLWPTKQTTVAILDKHALSELRGDEKLLDPAVKAAVGGSGGDDVRRDLPQSWSDYVTTSSDRSARTPRVGHDVNDMSTMMLEHEDSQTQKVRGVDSSLDSLISMESSIEDILVNGSLSLRQCLMHWSPLDLQANMLTSDGQRYKSVMIQLVVKLRRERSTGTSVDTLVHKDDGRTMAPLLDNEASLLYAAGSSVVEALCGGIPAAEWLVHRPRDELVHPRNQHDNVRTSFAVAKEQNQGDEPTRIATGDKGSTSLGWNVLQLLCALMYEEVSLTWNIDDRHNPPRIDSVVLPDLA